MSSEKGYLSLRLDGPLQSWGFDSQYNKRNTGLMPTKSAIAGMCCAAKGYLRGSLEEKEFLAKFSELNMLVIVIPRFQEYIYGKNVRRRELEVRRLQDYHTVQNTRKANGELNQDCVLTYRQYLNDALFGVILSGDKVLLQGIAERLADPVWGIWLGRKACIPSAPVLAGTKGQTGVVKGSQKEALNTLIGETTLETFNYQEDVDSFLNGKDSIPDKPVSFASGNRKFSLRRIRNHEAKR
jgi:CRISPR system Cascade subunit CasD